MQSLVIGEKPLSIEEVVAVANQQLKVALPKSESWQALIQRGADFLDQWRHLWGNHRLWRFLFG